MKNVTKASGVAMAILAFGLLLSCSGDNNKEPEAQASNLQALTQGEQPTAHDSSGPAESAPPAGNWEESFKLVRDAIRTEPSRFPLKTAQGVQWGQSGNSLEKALLLAQLLQDGGNSVQIAEGELDDAEAANLLGSIFPSKKTYSYKKDVPISVPAEDPKLISTVKRHFWVRMQSGDEWVDLDPSFPGAVPKRAYAAVKNTFDPSDEALKTRVSIVLEYTGADSREPQPVLSWEGKMEEVANQAVSLTVVAKFQTEAEEGEEKEGAGGMFGALGGQISEKKKGKSGETVTYNAALMLNEEALADGQASPGKDGINRLVIKLKFESLDEVVSESERVLFEKIERKAEAPIFQRHTMLIAPNRIPTEVWQSQLKAVSDKNVLADVKSRVEEIKKILKSEKIDTATLKKSADLEQKVGSALGHLVNMIFASTSDDLTRQESEALFVACYFPVPRILITSFTGDQVQSETSIDLRQDRVEAIPLSGQALFMKNTFLYGRGVTESILEGKLLQLLTGKPALTTAALMQVASQKGVPIRTYSSLERDSLRRISPPESVAKKLFSALDSGRVIVLPEKAIPWEGRQRWGWWDIDPLTMETIGVMDTGLHQAVLERTILDSKGPLESKMGFVIGAIVGAVDTQWMIAGMILHYGELNKAALLEAKAYMKEINALMCPGFEKKVGVSLGVTLVEIEDCWKYGIGVSAEAGVEIKQGWCENFAKGFACASTQILNYYLRGLED